MQRIRDLAWLRNYSKEDGHVAVTNVSSGYVTLSVMGPRSRELLSRVSPADTQNKLSNSPPPVKSRSAIEWRSRSG
ncbi:hypothetical protein [Mesorhizobium sp.]|uniref:hypothetical protein n=1 Tax=Mesorhizobium sp. TaxID=1871066 RepID=UPI0025EBD244|nr:hypothetical protein [Mesorhizobium sp.]